MAPFDHPALSPNLPSNISEKKSVNNNNNVTESSTGNGKLDRISRPAVQSIPEYHPGTPYLSQLRKCDRKPETLLLSTTNNKHEMDQTTTTTATSSGKQQVEITPTPISTTTAEATGKKI